MAWTPKGEEKLAKLIMKISVGLHVPETSLCLESRATSSTSSSSTPSSDTASEISEPRNEVTEEERDDDASADMCQPSNEEAPIRRPRNPSEPTPEEKQKHWAVHLPYRSWCPVCVKARGREDPHRAQKERKADLELPQISMDYAEIGNDQEEGEARKLLVGRDRQSKFTFCHLVKCKGTGDERIVKKVLQKRSRNWQHEDGLEDRWRTSNCTVAGTDHHRARTQNHTTESTST